jgi:CobQ-like glutamine amidotransferase family enzyme
MTQNRLIKLRDKEIQFRDINDLAQYPNSGYDSKSVNGAIATYDKHILKLIADRKNTLKKATLPERAKLVVCAEITLLEQLHQKYQEVY